MRPWAIFTLGALLLACGGAMSPSGGLGLLLDAERARAAAEVAPALIEGAELARARAEEAEFQRETEAAADLATEGRLLLAAATTELSRHELARRREELEERACALEREATVDAIARLETERRIAREVAGALALREAASEETQAAEDEPRRYRRHREERRSMHRRAAAVVIRRARLSLSAGRSLGVGEPELAALSLRLDEAAREAEPAEMLGQADRVATELRRLLLSARVLSARPAPAVARRLEEDARRAGFEVRREARGMVLSDPAFFDPRSSRPLAERYEQLLRLIRAYPEGALRLEVYGPIERQRRSRARASRLHDALTTDGISAARLESEAVGSDATDARGLRLDALFVAYLHAGR